MPTTPGLIRAKQTERLVAALPLPPALTGGSTVVRRTDVPALPQPLPTEGSNAIYGLSRIDASGRLRDARVFEELGWTAGCRLRVSLTSNGELGLATATDADPAHAVVALDPKGRLKLPVAAREAIRANPGTSVLLRADVTTGTAIAYGESALDKTLGASRDAA